MSRIASRLIYWSPRILSIAFAFFLSLFVLEAVNDVQGFWRIVVAFFMDLIPAMIIVVVLVIAWRWEWIGAGLFSLAAVYYALNAMSRHMGWAPVAGISIPLLAMAALFLVGWIERSRVRVPG
jgi:hypothetical protein